jgi:hypothetical protein
MLYTSRGDFREYDLLVSQFPAYVKSSFISQDDLFAGRWRASLEKLVAQPAPARRMAIDGTEVIAQLLREVMRD